MLFFKSLGKTNSFKTNNAELWSKKEVEAWFERIGLESFNDIMFGKHNPLLSSMDSGKLLIQSFQTIAISVDAMLEARQSCAAMYDPYAKYDENYVPSDEKTTELEGLIALFIQMGEDSASSSKKGQQSSGQGKVGGKFEDLPIHGILKRRLQSLDQLLKQRKEYHKTKVSSSSPTEEKSTELNPDEENDFFNFQNNFILDHLLTMQFFRTDGKSSKSNLMEATDINFVDTVKLGHLRKLAMQMNNLRDNANHFNEASVDYEKNKGTKPLFFTSNEKGGMFQSKSFESMEFGFIGAEVDCRLLSTKQVLEFLRYKHISHKCLASIIEDNHIDGQVFVTLRHPLEWKVLLYPYKSEINEKSRSKGQQPHPYENLSNLARAISNIVKSICSNRYLLGGGELKDLKQFTLE